MKIKAKHKVIERGVQRVIKTTMCAHPGCKWHGKDAQQGVCYSDEGEVAEFAKLDAHERQLTAELAEMRKREGKQYVKALEAYYVTAMMNWTIATDDCIRLRRDIAILRLANGSASRSKTRR